MTPADETRYIVYPRIGKPAYNHGIAESDIWYGIRNAVRQIDIDEELTMFIEPATDGELLESGVLDIDGEDPVVIHAMVLRPKFHRFLWQRGDDNATYKGGDKPSCEPFRETCRRT